MLDQNSSEHSTPCQSTKITLLHRGNWTRDFRPKKSEAPSVAEFILVSLSFRLGFVKLKPGKDPESPKRANNGGDGMNKWNYPIQA